MHCQYVILALAIFCISNSQASTCDLTSSPSSWANVRAKNVFFNAWQPDNLAVSGFCVNNDFFSHSLNYSSHVNLADSKATVQKDVATAKDLDPSQINCGKANKQVIWCRSHCQDSTLEDLIINTAVINGSLPLNVAQQVFQQLDSPTDLAIAALQVDQNTADIHVDYDYYDDKNFCSVYLKVKKATTFPYVILLTAQKVIV